MTAISDKRAADDVVRAIVRKPFRVGQLWRERVPCPKNNFVRIEAITDHPKMPVIGRNTTGGGCVIDCYQHSGRCQDFSEPSEFDLVDLIEDVPEQDIGWDS